jgi:cell wall-associated NlpC family hydrolase
VVPYRSHRRPAQRGQSWPARVVVLSAVAGALVPAVPAGAQPGDRSGPPSGPALNSRIDTLYERAEAATQRYDATLERVHRLRDATEHAADRAARGQARVNTLRDALGSFAGAQYRSGGIDPALALLLSSHPDDYLERAAALDRVSGRQEHKLTELLAAQRSLRQERSVVHEELTRLRHHQRELKRRKAAVREKLAEARRLLHTLTPAQRDARERATRSAGRSSESLLGGGGEAPSSLRAAAALAAARSVLGRPYVWGAAGPSAFDCSGLTQWAYGQAGAGIPRTSQGQRVAGRQVPLSQARPGDLVIYREDASHVGMYAGHGQVIHSPHPGAQVRYDPVGMLPVSAVTRP